MLPPGPSHPANLTWWFPPLHWHLMQHRATSRKIHDYSAHLCSPIPAWVDILQVGHRVALTPSRQHYGCDSLDSCSHVWYVRSLGTLFKSSLGNLESTKLSTVGFKRAHGDIEGVRGSCAARRATLRILDTACSPPSSVAPQYTDLCGGRGMSPKANLSVPHLLNVAYLLVVLFLPGTSFWPSRYFPGLKVLGLVPHSFSSRKYRKVPWGHTFNYTFSSVEHVERWTLVQASLILHSFPSALGASGVA